MVETTAGLTGLADLARASDQQISAVLSAPGVLGSVVAAAVAHLDEHPPGPIGNVRIRVERFQTSDTPVDWTIAFSADRVRLAEGAEPHAEVSLRVGDLVRLAAGDADGALLYLGEKLDVVGDEDLVLALGTALCSPVSGRPVVDPAALDPEAVSAAIAAVRTAHLSSVMAGGFRDLVLSEVFRRLPGFLIAEKARGVTVAVAFEIERGEDGAEVDRYVVRVAEGECVVEADAPADAAVDATLVLAGHEFLRLVLGHLNPVRGVLSGQVRVRGQVLKALGFNSVMNIPGS